MEDIDFVAVAADDVAAVDDVAAGVVVAAAVVVAAGSADGMEAVPEGKHGSVLLDTQNQTTGTTVDLLPDWNQDSCWRSVRVSVRLVVWWGQG